MKKLAIVFIIIGVLELCNAFFFKPENMLHQIQKQLEYITSILILGFSFLMIVLENNKHKKVEINKTDTKQEEKEEIK